MVGLAETQFDLKFRLLGVPVRINPFFWGVAAFMGWRDNNLPLVLLWVLCVLLSILVHEYGHALMSRAFGCTPSIVLYGMGGLCYSQGERQSPRERLAVVFAGPGAGFLLLGLVMFLGTLVFGITPSGHVQAAGSIVGFGDSGEVATKIARILGDQTAGQFAFDSYRFLVFINLYWGLLNLLPIWPLDGGQAAQILLSLYDRQRGQRWSHIVALLVAGGLALVVYQRFQDMFLTFMFGCLAFVNYQMLQTLHQAHSMGLYQEDEWWRK
jgi:membrane-associated protease RseP (regulator of RpoE activity)